MGVVTPRNHTAAKPAATRARAALASRGARVACRVRHFGAAGGGGGGGGVGGGAGGGCAPPTIFSVH